MNGEDLRYSYFIYEALNKNDLVRNSTVSGKVVFKIFSILLPSVHLQFSVIHSNSLFPALNNI